MQTDDSELPLVDVVAVGAHPDDVEIGCGGVLAKLVEQGRRVGIVDLTDGEPTPGSPGPEARLAEAALAAELLGASFRVTLDLPNRRLFDSHGARLELAKVFRRAKPRMVLGIGDRTPMASPDHWQALQITDAAVFYSRLTKWDDQFDGLPPHRIGAQLYYSLALHAMGPPSFGSPLAVDVDSVLETKLAAIRAYVSQFPPEKQGVLERVRVLAAHYGDAAGLRHAELLTSPRGIGTRDLMGVVLPPPTEGT